MSQMSDDVLYDRDWELRSLLKATELVVNAEQVESLIKYLDYVIDRAKYHQEPPTLGIIEELKSDLQIMQIGALEPYN